MDLGSVVLFDDGGRDSGDGDVSLKIIRIDGTHGFKVKLDALT